MKKYIWILLGLCLTGLASCENWLDVKPKEQVEEGDLFATGSGFRSALNYVYREMSSPELYGQELSWGFTEVLAQYYDLSNCNKPAYKAALESSVYDYKHSETEALIEKIWSKGFNAIAHCNNIIQNIEKADPVIFDEREVEKKLIWGEALAARACLHFDMLRLFAPAPKLKNSGKYIPYCTKFPAVDNPAETVDTVMKRVIRDLNQARNLVASFDTVRKAQISDVKQRLLANGMDFLGNRGYRLNYYAITALLARVYLYGEDYKNAYQEALAVYTSGMFKLVTSKSEYTGGNTKLRDEIVFSLYNNKLTEYYEALNYKSNAGKAYLVAKNLDIYDQDKDDYRRKEFIKDTNNFTVSMKYFPARNPAYVASDKMIPMIRFSEIYHILTETAFTQADKDKSQAYLYYLRYYRGAKRQLAFTDEESMLKELTLDIRKEYIGEGQTFFMYKRLNRNIMNNKNELDMSKNFVLPIPVSETVH